MRKLPLVAALLIFSLSFLVTGCTNTGEVASHQKPTTTVTIPIPPTITPSPKPSPTPVPTRVSHLNVNAAALDGTVIYFWAPWIEQSRESSQQLIEKFNTENLWGIEVVTYFPGGTNALYDQMLHNRTGDFLPSVAVLTAGQMQSWQKQTGLLVDLTHYLDDPEWGLPEKDIADFVEGYIQQNQVDGSLLGMPAQQTAEVLFYNLSWARELGFDALPATHAEFKEQSCSAAQAIMQDENKANDGTGGWLINRNAAVTASWMAAFGSEEFLSPGTSEYVFDNDENQAAITYLRGLFDNNCSWISRLPTPYDYFASRQALFYSGTLSDIPIQVQAHSRAGSSDEWTIIPYPTVKDEPVILTQGSSYVILSASPEEQLASWLLISWLAQPEQQAELLKTEMGLPVSSASAVMAEKLFKQFPQWAQAVQLMPLMETMPQSAEWRRISPMLEDAVWQLYQVTTLKENLPDILSMLDQTILETRTHTPQD